VRPPRVNAHGRTWGEASARLEGRTDELLTAGDTQSRRAARAIARINRALTRQDRALTTEQGLLGRPWFRHQIYAPGLVAGYAVQYLPGMRDAIEQGDEETAASQPQRKTEPTPGCCSSLP
jgi:N-acetylated-alpha-linked acidic dipeptidase